MRFLVFCIFFTLCPFRIDTFAFFVRPENERLSGSDFYFRDSNGDKISFHELIGSSFVLYFWAPWQADCIVGMESLDNFYKMFLSDDEYLNSENKIQFFPIAFGIQDYQSALSFYTKNEIRSLDIFYDVGGDLKFLDIAPLPLTLIFDCKGRLAVRESGYIDWKSPDILGKINSVSSCEKGDYW